MLNVIRTVLNFALKSDVFVSTGIMSRGPDFLFDQRCHRNYVGVRTAGTCH